ncbi:MAG TPA: TDT family transporter [Clostridia bacterium]|nr:TDT family transporter [Clostridia bacterium]
METFKRMPLTVYGVMVALSSLGNLLAGYGDPIKYFCGGCAVLILIALLLRVIFFFTQTKADLQNPLLCSISPTVSMSVMILSTYVKPFAPIAAYIIWIAAIALFVVTIVYFIVRFVVHFNFKTVFPSWFAVSAGGVVASVTCGAYDAQNVGQIIFYIGFAASVILFPIVVYRMFIIRDVPIAARPTYFIFAAPFNLCLAGYVGAFAGSVNPTMFYILFTLALATLLPCLVSLPFLVKRPFYPSYAGFAFTTAISGVAMKSANGVIAKLAGQPVAALNVFVGFMELLAFAVVFYVFIRYIIFSIKKPKPVSTSV